LTFCIAKLFPPQAELSSFSFSATLSFNSMSLHVGFIMIYNPKSLCLTDTCSTFPRFHCFSAATTEERSRCWPFATREANQVKGQDTSFAPTAPPSPSHHLPLLSSISAAVVITQQLIKVNHFRCLISTSLRRQVRGSDYDESRKISRAHKSKERYKNPKAVRL